MIEIYSTNDRLQGEIIKAFLGAQGIFAEVNQESSAQTIGIFVGHLGKVHIFVPENQAQEAVACLNAMEAGEYENLSDTDTSLLQNDSNPDI